MGYHHCPIEPSDWSDGPDDGDVCERCYGDGLDDEETGEPCRDCGGSGYKPLGDYFEDDVI